jgi:aminobenzoyl-glutamate utilization protein B
MKRLYAVATATTIILCLYGTGSSAELSTENQAKLMKSVDSYAARMSDVALKIWSEPELGYQETKASALLQDELKRAGFKIEAGVAGIPTAFVARAGASEGPVIAILAEIDALPGMSQAAVPERKPIPDQIAGHACGHHLFGSGSVAAAIAVKNWLQETGMKGPDPRLWHTCRRRRRRQGLYGSG